MPQAEHSFIDYLSNSKSPDTDYRAPVAQLVEHWAVMREVVSSTPAGPTPRVLK